MVWDFAPLMDIPPQSPGYRGCVTGRPGSAVYAAAHPPNRLKRFFHHRAAQPKCLLPSPLQDQQSVPPFFSHTARPFAAPCGFFPPPPSHFPCGGPCTFAFSNFLKFCVDKAYPACYNTKCSDMEHTTWGYSSAGRALDWQSRGQRFDPAYLHQNDTTFRRVVFLFPMLFVRSFQHTQHAPAADSLVRGGRVCFLQYRFLLDQKIPRCSSRILLPNSTRMMPPASSARRW